MNPLRLRWTVADSGPYDASDDVELLADNLGESPTDDEIAEAMRREFSAWVDDGHVTIEPRLALDGSDIAAMRAAIEKLRKERDE